MSEATEPGARELPAEVASGAGREAGGRGCSVAASWWSWSPGSQRGRFGPRVRSCGDDLQLRAPDLP